MNEQFPKVNEEFILAFQEGFTLNCWCFVQFIYSFVELKNASLLSLYFELELIGFIFEALDEEMFLTEIIQENKPYYSVVQL